MKNEQEKHKKKVNINRIMTERNRQKSRIKSKSAVISFYPKTSKHAARKTNNE